ncbi:type I polyketide synthase [Alkalinema sp. FACHB-956]|uniref:type I polyketide synthase n=1 Tax=Alkalinema sp. FACHB-956 TaxID=2692768 RepID=UPI001689891B|nr:type I polyketide synthase [Alkalinema sp. FACHB-956]MBD2328047.1 SDR family NAD(P)-dependent oxidoreductase [Alkalinema sp. FACHB-956]
MNSQQTGLEIAVIGLSGQFPGADTIEQFWQNLATGQEQVTAFSSHNPKNSIVRAGGILTGVDQFDAGFFGFTPREAEVMDPQHRLFLEQAWMALENAGYSSEQEERSIGVFAGVGMGTYLLYNLSPTPGLLESRGFLQTLVGVDKDYLPTRVSYKLNLKGPSLSVGTACSSSLVAVHLACQSLLSGECDLALAAGVAVKVPQSEVTLSPDEIASPDGHCRAFDCNANGTVGGNGIGVIVLKRLEDAIADRDHVYAVVKGSAINNDGAMKVGYTAPSQEGQAKVIRSAHLMAEVEPETITYLEAHGTGTALGDPIEVAAMTQAFRLGTDRQQFCAIGSVKTNVGHLDAAAGITGFIKTVLALHHRQIPPSLNFAAPNPQIDFANSPFYVNNQLQDWPTNGSPRRAGVSSFGFGGTNAHVVLEEAPIASPPTIDEAPSQSERPYQVLTLSTKTPTALNTALQNLKTSLQATPDRPLADIAYTLNLGRWQFNQRWVTVVKTVEEAIAVLDSQLHSQSNNSGSPKSFIHSLEQVENPVIFMFPGQGAQHVNMARELYERESVFQTACDRCFAILQVQSGLDLRSILYPDPETIEQSTDQLTQTEIAQPALFVIEYALAQLWMAWGVEPQAMIGHSIGEYVAACLADVFSLSDALELVSMRGRLMQQQPMGAMLAVSRSAADLQPWLTDTLVLAAVNSPTLSVLSGSIDEIAALENTLTAQAIDCRRLNTSHAFHSPMMAGAIDPFLQQLRRIALQSPTKRFISNLTGTWITAEQAIDPEYWAQHLQQTVQFSPGITELLKNSAAVFLEVGPGTTLATLARQQAPGRSIFSSLPHPKQTTSEIEAILQTVGQLWVQGITIDWASFYAGQPRHRVPLPTYPFERQRYWIDAPSLATAQGSSSESVQALLRKTPELADWFYLPSWQRSTQQSTQSLTQTLNKASDRPCSWVLFMDSQGVATTIASRLRQQGQRVIEVFAGDLFSQSQLDAYTINPQAQNHYDLLLQAILQTTANPISPVISELLFVHCWTVEPSLSLTNTQTLGFQSLLSLAQAIGQSSFAGEVTIGVVSSNMQEVTGTESIEPDKATILGPCRVIPQEYANITCREIDLEFPIAASQMNTLTDSIIVDILQASQSAELRGDAPIVAYRGQYRWVPTYESLRVESAVPNSVLRTQGVYVLTGGLGGIGLTIAECLAKTVQARLVLISRSPFPDRSEWDTWLLNHDEQDRTSRKIRKIQTLELMDAKVLVITADVTDRIQMQTAIEQAQQVFGTIHGVFHTAGVAGDGIIQLKTQAEADRVMAPKVLGTQILQEVLQFIPIDFLVLFSSHSALLGGLGQVDYCAANAFLDAVAHGHNTTGTIPTLSINWDIWQDVGMGADLANLPDRLRQERLDALEIGISPQEGWEVLQRLLQLQQTQGISQVIVSTKDWATVLEQNRNRRINTDNLPKPAESSNLKAITNTSSMTSTSEGYARTLQTTQYITPTTELEQQIAELWQEQLGIAQIGIHDNFFDLGGHSLLAVRVVSRLRERYGVELSLRTLLSDAPTVAGLAAVIGAQLLPEPETESEAEAMARILAEIEQLSQTEVQAQLARE